MGALRGFKDFIMRGNVVDLAVAVVIGAAFSALVTAFTTKIIQPLINSITKGNEESKGLGFDIRHGNPSTHVDFSAVLSALIYFLIVAAVVYFFVVLPMNTLQDRLRRGQEPPPAAPPEDTLLLRQIRDLLEAQRSAAVTDAHGRHTDPPPA